MPESATTIARTLSVPAVFGDHMVLQRHKPIHLWGEGEPGSIVSVILGDGEVKKASVDDDGDWRLTLPPHEVARGLDLLIADSDTALAIHDVSVGEVWIAGGQSNMEFHLEFDADRQEVLDGPMNLDIRFFDVPEISYAGQDTEYDFSNFDHWRTSTPEDLRYFSAVGYYFAADLHASLDVPIGIVGLNWGGTPASAWTERTRLADGPAAVWIEEFEAGLQQFDVEQEALAFRSHKMNDRSDPFGDPVLSQLMRYGFAPEEEAALLASMRENVLFTVGTLHPNRPSGLFETMVRRVAGYSARGVIWYQGESDVPHANVHAAALTALIESWREAWEDPQLFFLVTQLAPFGGNLFGNGDTFPEVRAQQALVAETTPLTWLASSSDAGMERDIHPKRKKPIGKRLALLARGHVYEQDIVCDAPQGRDTERTERGVRIRLHHADGLHWDGLPLPIRIRDENGEVVPFNDVTLDGTCIEVTGEIPARCTVEFAWSGFYNVGLRNSADIPAAPFRLPIK